MFAVSSSLDNVKIFQLSTPSNASIMTVSASGFVGINTATPAAELHVVGNKMLVPDEVFFSSDTDLGFRKRTADQIEFRIAGGDKMVLGQTFVVLESNTNMGINFTPESFPNDHQLEIAGTQRISSSQGGLAITGSNQHGPAALLVVSGNIDNTKLLHLATPSNANALVVTGSGLVGIGVSDPDAELEVNGTAHISTQLHVGAGTRATDRSIFVRTATTGESKVEFRNESGNAGARMTQMISSTTGSIAFNAPGGSDTGVLIRKHQTGQAKGGTLFVQTRNHSTALATRLIVEDSGSVSVGPGDGAGATPKSLNGKEFEVNNGTQYIYFDVGGTDSYIVNNSTNLNFLGGGQTTVGLNLNRYGAGFIKDSLGQTAAAIANDADGDIVTDSAVYLADSGATIVVDYLKGRVGTITLTADVTAIKIFNAPTLGSSMTSVVKITQHASAAKTISYATVNIYSDAGSTTKNGSLLWSGGASHTMTSETGSIDMVQFTCVPTSAADRDVYAAVIGQNFS